MTILPLFNAEMRIDRRVSSCSGEIFIFSIGNVLASTIVTVLLGKTKIDQKDLITMPTNAHQKVIGFDARENEEKSVSATIPTSKSMGFTLDE